MLDWWIHYEDDGYIEVSGYCAWSVICSIGAKDQYSDKEYPSTSLLEESELLNLDIEVYSTEPGGFAEHYHYHNGEVLADECVEYWEHYWDKEEYPTLKEYNAEYNTHFTMEDFAERDGCIAVIGGFPNKWVA